MGRRLERRRWPAADKYQFGDPALAVARDIVRGFPPSRRMADVNRVAQIQMLDDRGRVRRVVVHVVAVAHLARAAMAAPVNAQ